MPQLKNFGLWVRVLEKMYRKCPDWTIWEYEYIYFKKCIESAPIEQFWTIEYMYSKKCIQSAPIEQFGSTSTCTLKNAYKVPDWTILEYNYVYSKKCIESALIGQFWSMSTKLLYCFMTERRWKSWNLFDYVCIWSFVIYLF